MGLCDDLTWDKLTEPERKLAECVRDGKVCDFTNGKKFDPKDPKSWNDQPEIRGRVIAALATGELKDKDGTKITPTRNGVQFLGARIPDGINLSNSRVECLLSIFQSLIIGVLDVARAYISLLIISKSRIEGVSGRAFRGDGLYTDKDLFLRSTVLVGEVLLFGANIRANFECDASTFENTEGDTLSADGIKTGGDANFEGITSKGRFRLLGANIGGDLNCYKAIFENEGSIAFNADRLKTGGVANFNNVTSKGVFRLLGADIGGDLSCNNCVFANQNGDAFNAQSATVTSNFFWRSMEIKPKGRVNFSRMCIGTLADQPGSWPEMGNLELDGFDYNAVAPFSPTDAASRLQWLGLMPRNRYTPQPYRQLAKVLHQMGHESEARAISIARMDTYASAIPNMKAYAQRPLAKWLHLGWLRFIKWTAGYGYRPWRALMIAGAIMVLSAVVTHDAYHRGVMHPVKERVYLDACYAAAPSDKCSTWLSAERRWAEPIRLPKDYPEFNALIYAIDAFFPFVDLHQEDYWEPNAAYWNGFFRLWLWLTIAAGWILSTIGIAAFTGIVKDKDD